MLRRPLSLTLRLTLMYGIASVIVFSLFDWVVIQSTEQHFKDQDSDELEVIALAVQAVLSDDRAPRELALLEQRFADILVGHHNASLYVIEPSGQTLYASPGPDLSALASAPSKDHGADAVFDWDDRDHSYRVLTESVHKPAETARLPYTFAVAVPIDHHLRFLVSFQRNLTLLTLMSIALMSLLGWVAVRQGHAPLHNIIERMRRIRAHELDIRLSADAVPTELRELTITFNEMLERVDEAFQRLSDFNAHIAHELRTPLATLTTQTEVSLSRARTADEYREILYSNMEEYNRLTSMVSEMLFLAQSDNRRQYQGFTEFELASEIDALFEFYEGWAEERAVTLALTGTAKATGDRLMLRRALSNLLSNAIRHTPAGGTVQVALQASPQHGTRIAVANPGPTIPPEHLPRLFDRFYRVDPARQHGSDQGVGLGLAIVKSIVNAHGGTIGVVSASDCTRFEITLPPGITSTTSGNGDR